MEIIVVESGGNGVNTSPALEGKKIIIADDEAFVRRHITKKLLSLGLTVFEAETGQQVLDLLCSQPDLILMDVKMPEIDGYETTKQIKSDDSTSGIPIILLSALSGYDDIEYGYSVGANDFLTKPVTFAIILDTIRRQLNSISL
jgi:CheY-like chemotaxis protein